MRIFLIILGALIALLGFGCGAAGLAAYRSVDSDGYVEGGGHMSTATAAFVTDTAEFESVDANEATKAGKVRLRIAAERQDGGPVFVGIGKDVDVADFVADGSFTTVRDLEFGPFDYQSVAQGGSRPLPSPAQGAFSASATGEGRQELVWPIEAGRWRAVIMNADGSPGVDVEVSFAAKFPYLRGFAIAGMVIGVVLLLVGLLLVIFQARGGRKRPPRAAPAEGMSEDP